MWLIAKVSLIDRGTVVDSELEHFTMIHDRVVCWSDADAGGPLQVQYMRLTRGSLRLMGLWPPPEPGCLSLRKQYLLVVLNILTLAGELQYIRTNIQTATFLELGHCYITVLMTVTNTQRISIPIFHKDFQGLVREFVKDMHLFHLKHRSEYSMKVFRSVNRICTMFTYALHGQMVTGALLFNLAPFLTNLRVGLEIPAPPGVRYQLSIFYWLPFDYQGSVEAFVGVNAINIFFSFIVGFYFVIVDLFISLLIFHTWGHLKILRHNIGSFPSPAACDKELRPAIYSVEESQHILQLLKDNIDHHRKIMQFVDECTRVFGPMLFVYSAFHQICLCILLLECSTLDSAALIEYGPLTLILVEQLILLSAVFELLGTESELLPDAVYAMPWERMQARERRVVLLLLRRVQVPSRLRALGLVPVGINTALTILKTSLSYFFMLQTMSQHH